MTWLLQEVLVPRWALLLTAAAFLVFGAALMRVGTSKS